MRCISARLTGFMLLGLSAVHLGACSESELILPGEREAILSQTQSFAVNPDSAASPAILGAPTENLASGHPGISSGHNGAHLSLNLPLRKLWSAKIESVDNNLNQLPQPVIAGGRVLALGGDGVLNAFDLETGSRLWSAELNPDEQNIYPGIAGGVAASDTIVAAHISRNSLSVMDIATGALLWDVTHDMALRGGPTIIGTELIAVTDMDGRVFVYQLADGTLFWQRTGLPVNTIIYGATSPAFNANELVLAGAGGEVSVHQIQTGDILWTDTLASLLPNTPLESLGDILAHPVHDGRQVYVISQAGRFAAFDAQSGFMAWEHPFAGSQLPWIAGDSVYLVTLTGRLVSLRLSDGMIRWVSKLKGALPEGKAVSDDGPIYLGPIVASGQVLLLSQNGQISRFDAMNGNALGSTSIGGSFDTPPTAASGYFVTLSSSGNLTVMR